MKRTSQKLKHLSFLIFIFFITTSYSQNNQYAASNKKLKQSENGAPEDFHLVIGLKNAPPFVFLHKNRPPTGLSIKLWENMVKNSNYTFEYKNYDSVEELLNAVETKKIDLSINPITVSVERMKRIDFSLPFFITSTTFSKNKKNKAWQFIKNIFSWNFLLAVGVLILVILLSGIIIWLAERKKNDDFAGKPVVGIGHGFWWSAVTMTTVGYGDKSPLTFWGRFIGFIWMFTAIIMISSLTASIASSLTVQTLNTRIDGIIDLKEKKVGTVGDSRPAEFL